MSKQLYIAFDLRSGELLGAFWAENSYEAQRYFEVEHPFLGDELCVELASESDLSEEEIIDAFPEAFIEENLDEAASEEVKDDMVTIRCANAAYEDDDGYPCNVGIYAGDLSFDELTEILYDAGMIYVDIYDEYEKEIEARYASSYKPGQVVDVFDTDEDFINDFIAANDLDPDEYEHIGFFEGKINRAKTHSHKLKESYRRTVSRGASLVDNELFVDFN